MEHLFRRIYYYGSCSAISDSGLTGEFAYSSDSLTPTPLSNLKNLTKLNISRNPLITNNGCIKAIQCLRLEVLYLRDCDNLVLQKSTEIQSSEYGIELQLQKQNPCLQDFVISSLSRRYEKPNERKSRDVKHDITLGRNSIRISPNITTFTIRMSTTLHPRDFTFTDQSFSLKKKATKN
ncbi:hypothetical protein NPIL_352261 [Nephila pilipes]|uniref:Uncharacterized protein n=1 Tax=Nephila pilipes TaxID=299642 RepID=A0A8X6NTI4_NEPPI|nr:hypothetical protein NPIL_352261 [Nephila pilipes]